ncbi:MAG: acetylornithine aminotransferase [Firmicutes bacterium ZCTH02-B6]|nr:MAG: acetylornithine aminotransferase [Firmicutes bacterium ZCTH02-B6]
MRDLAEIQALTAQHVMNTYNRLPIALVRGEGVRVWDTEGRPYLDFIGGIGVNSLGHGHPAVLAAIRDALGYVLHTSNQFYIEPQARLAERLTGLSGLGKVFFCNSGTEANEAAIKLVRRWGRQDGRNRYKIIAAQKSFHGRTLGSLAATGQPKYHEGFEPLPGGFVYVPFNDLDALKAAIDEETVAVMLEPVQGESGVYPADLGYLRAVRELCDAHGLLLILDEVQAGLGRTGRLFAFEHYGIRPDVLTLAKALGSGIPIGAMLARDEVAQAFAPGAHGTTFGGNPFACRVALAVLDTIVGQDLPKAAAGAGEHLRWALEDLGRRRGWVREVRGLGLMVGVELEGVTAPRVQAEAQARGLLVNAIGSSILRLLPPLIVSREELDEAVGILEAAMEAASAV